ncbi:MAG: hypothetical protein KGN39_01705 [Betaproteobacteria bacterium]|nr:hypothetical protein [Betaproteobacteria bacterium]
MLFAQFYQRGAVSGAPIEACGDRAVIILDGRGRADMHRLIAASEAKKRGYIGYSILQGATFCRDVRTVTPLTLV